MKPTEQSGQEKGVFSRPIVRVVLTIVIGIGLVIGIINVCKIADVAQKIHPIPLAFSFATSVLTFLFLGLTLNRLLEFVNKRLSFRDIFANNLFSTGGYH